MFASIVKFSFTRKGKKEEEKKSCSYKTGNLKVEKVEFEKLLGIRDRELICDSVDCF